MVLAGLPAPPLADMTGFPSQEKAGVPSASELAITKRNGPLKPGSHVHRTVKRTNRNETVETGVYEVLPWAVGGGYYVNLTVGTPPQEQVVHIDTGSSVLYFDASAAAACRTTGEYSCRGGTFNSDDSSTYSLLAPSPAFREGFEDGTRPVGSYAKDVIGIGNVRIEAVPFGLAQDVKTDVGYSTGLLGLGFNYLGGGGGVYPNMPEVMRDAGIINSRLFSINLNSVEQISGSILFGGIDTSKYSGDLVTLSLLPNQRLKTITDFTTTLTDLSFTRGHKTHTLFAGGTDSIDAYDESGVLDHTNPSMPVILDTGSSGWVMSNADYYSYIAPVFRYVDPHGFCACSHRYDSASLTLTFGGKANITVDAKEFIIPIYNATTNEPIPYSDDEDACAFMINPEPKLDGLGLSLLGDAILRSMYVVFDLDNAQVSIAQAAVNSTKASNIVAIPAGPSGIGSVISSSYSAAPTNTWPIAKGVSSKSRSFAVSTAQSTIGAASGTAAVPAIAQISDDGIPGLASQTKSVDTRGGEQGGGKGSENAAATVWLLCEGWHSAMTIGCMMLFMAIGVAALT